MKISDIDNKCQGGWGDGNEVKRGRRNEEEEERSDTAKPSTFVAPLAQTKTHEKTKREFRLSSKLP